MEGPSWSRGLLSVRSGRNFSVRPIRSHAGLDAQEVDQTGLGHPGAGREDGLERLLGEEAFAVVDERWQQKKPAPIA